MSRARQWTVGARFTATVFVGSFLLFLVQPMIARLALPRLGGAPAVWNSAMLVYQALLLAGYAYAHLLGRLAPRKQAAVHLGVFALAAFSLPIGLLDLDVPQGAGLFLWVPWLLLVSVGPLFFVISAQTPLLQRWFALTSGKDPYPLYAASNLGSFAGLFAYPLLVEPMVAVADQRWYWSAAYLGLAALAAWCALALPRTAPVDQREVRSTRPARNIVLSWIMVAAIPSGLVLSTTLYITTDIVAIPLLWALPLGLYLLSFTVAFGAPEIIVRPIMWAAPVVLLLNAVLLFSAPSSGSAVLFAGLSALGLFLVSVSLHRRLYETRPPADQLTAFYLALAVGGVLGGLFCALIAPLLFDWTYEHALLIVAAALLLTARSPFKPVYDLWDGGRLANVVTLIGIPTVLLLSVASIPLGRLAVAPAILVVAIAAIGNRPLFAAAVASLVLTTGGWNNLRASVEPGRLTRSFFGVYTLEENARDRAISHGTTVHGIQNRGSPERERMPTTYYAPRSGVGLVLSSPLIADTARVGLVGLGAGTLSCYARPAQQWTIYEIDPVVVQIASDPRRFSFLSRCLPKRRMVIGDARLTLARETAPKVDMLIIDAFSSDSIPVHLLTREAFQIYRQRLKDDGLLLVHISNRYLHLDSVLGAEAEAAGWSARIRIFKPKRADRSLNYFGSDWVVLSPSQIRISALEQAEPGLTWLPLPPPVSAPWSDDHASLLPVLKF
ncbi:hypothetical protein G7077_03465 [Sphingomonas piscis]|uniref:Spermidine synthase n=1 Tax=Sphingomonas piscis TaxID=2714943 RepID=A0A6G7YT47_9SPHN|nr:fused MFS/spermidine synthase [Sphingomonas piscis]QIK79909.1 hypothetical protein G7077_03465 [Sphingomonas piscis]